MKRTIRLPLATAAAALALCAGTSMGMNDDGFYIPGGVHTPSAEVTDFRTVSVPGTSTVLYLWNEGEVPHYAISRDGGATLLGRVRSIDYTINLRYAGFDPLTSLPGVAGDLKAAPGNTVRLVQFHTVPLDEFRSQIEAMGGEVVRYIASHTHIVRMSDSVAQQVENLPYVRWVGEFHPAYRLSDEILSSLVVGAPESLGEYSIEVFARGEDEQNTVGAMINNMGGEVMNTNPFGHRMTVRLTPSMVVELAKRNEVHFMDPWGPGGVDTDIAKQLNGVTAGPNIAGLGFTGEGVRGEIFDTGVENHPDLQPKIDHGSPGGGGHGTNVAGIPFGNGANGGPTGFAPDREVVIGTLYNRTTQFGGSVPRHQHTEELVDPSGPFRAVLQTSSVGSPRNTQYTTISAETDDYLFIHQLFSTQSMSNANLVPQTRPQAWAKNIMGIGGITHNNNLNRLDDRSSGSTGPAADGRIKPDLSHHYDGIWTTSGSSGYTTGFGGTSGATPTTVGNAALAFQMWHEGVFPGKGGGATVFESRPNMTTMKAMLINSAHHYDWNAGGSNANMVRLHQGWGMADVGTLYENRNKMMILDEPSEDVLRQGQSVSYDFNVSPGEPALRVTLCYVDTMGPTSSLPHRINDLSLRVTSPSGDQYWGNVGLTDDHESETGGSSNTLDTVENVFLSNPEPGTWTIEVIGDEIVEDTHVETPAVDADFSLVASGGEQVLGVAIRTVGSLPDLVAPGEPVDLTVSVTPGNSSIVPGSEMFHYRMDSGASFITEPLTPIGNMEYTASMPAGECGNEPQFFFTAEDAAKGTVSLPSAGAAAPFEYEIGTLATINQLSEGFESGVPAGWTTSGLWRVTSQCAPASPCEGSSFAYYGNPSTCTYQTGSSRNMGELTSPMIQLPSVPAGGSLTLSYCYNLETEANQNFDKAEVRINGEVVDEPDATNDWTQVEIDLEQYAGQTVELSFFFDTVDGLTNTFRGFQVDDVRIVSVSAECNACYADCDGNTVLDVFDFLCFQDAFTMMDPYADCDGNTVFDVFDFLCFQDQFTLGCP
jgi:hypothetical protein